MIKGMALLWGKDIGSASFLFNLLLGLGMALLFGKIDAKEQQVSIFFGLSIFSGTCAILWQIIRLQATEWAELVPGYRAMVLRQCRMLLLFVLLANLAVAQLIYQSQSIVALQGLAWAIAAAFALYCLRQPSKYQLSLFLFVVLFALDDIAPLLPAYCWWTIALALAALLSTQIKRLRWNSDGMTVYRNGIECGWLWMPKLGSSQLQFKISRWFYPIPHFMGSGLVSMLALAVAFPLLAFMVNIGWDKQFPAPLIAGVFTIFTGLMVHWNRVMRSRNVTSLLLLPLYNGVDGLRQGFECAQLRLLFTAMVIVLFSVGLQALLLQVWPWQAAMHLLLTTYWGGVIGLALGCLCAKPWHMAVMVFFYGLQNGFMSAYLADVGQMEAMPQWLLWFDVLMALVSTVFFRWSNQRLWRNGLPY
ncbi:hypothetical protein JYB87_18220 [Shewanella avicenniae]|uniref:ABC transporter permease n=1 Tax=Shewanella avicenniae TaxID=2814294 RepID=A0ABX7QQ62_9GAMM|nr:hypothetical protein [Shewanella avicenniae]QSX33618.1 hypothetical protein JYB87_18220 [Shewanella avicenniae]